MGLGPLLAFLFAPGDLAVVQRERLGARHIACQPMLDYWLRMAAAAFGCIGLAAALACWKPRKFAALVPIPLWVAGTGKEGSR